MDDDAYHRYGFRRVKGGYVPCNCKNCNPHPKPPKQSHRKPAEEPAEDNWSRV